MESVVDLLKVAIENEVKARVYYESASDLSEDGESQMVFLELVDMESGHARLLVDRFGAFLKAEGVDAEALLKDLESSVEAGPVGEAAKLLESADMRSVVEFATRMEEDARDNYLALVRQVPEPEMIDFCRELAAEEQSHFDLLSKLRLSMDTEPEERPGL